MKVPSIMRGRGLKCRRGFGGSRGGEGAGEVLASGT